MSNALQLDIDSGVALVTFDTPGSKANVLGQAVLAELEEILTTLESAGDLIGLVLRSGKPGMFIAGADLNELSDPSMTSEHFRPFVRRGLAIIDRIERLPFPTVALIDGPCVGGGLELALGFDDRVAGRHPRAELGLPETKIGLIPGWGGTQRLSRLIGPHLAADMIVSGESVSASRARELGLVFDVVDSARLLEEGRRRLEPLRDEFPARRLRKRQPVGLTDDQLRFGIETIRGQTLAKTRGQYPAPLAALDAIEAGCNRTLEEGLDVETDRFMSLVGGEISRNLIALFFENQRLARDRGVDDPGVAPRSVERVGVIGAGVMGAGIAAAHLRREIPVSIVDASAEALRRGVAAIEEGLVAHRERGKDPAGVDPAAFRPRAWGASTDVGDALGCDLVIEAIVENEEAKTSLFRSIAPRLKADTILASNTSTISISRMAAATNFPDRFAGLHFFNPVDRMPLVEVVRGEKTSDTTVATLVAQVKRLGKTAIVVRDGPGFLVNRILFPYLNEALVLVEEGVSPRDVDAAAVAFGMPMGPIALCDVVGLDTCLFAGRVLESAFPERTARHSILSDLVAAGRFGQKSGAGFYSYTRGSRGEDDPALVPFLERRRPAPATVPQDMLIDRLILPMVGEAGRVVKEGIVRTPADVDMGLILGIGFPKFRGGLFRWAENVGWPEIRRRMKALEPLGDRFAPTEWIRERPGSPTR